VYHPDKEDKIGHGLDTGRPRKRVRQGVSIVELFIVGSAMAATCMPFFDIIAWRDNMKRAHRPDTK
jgi:hypothetical protein